ncbi:MAG TPA: hypothetical protein VL443_27730 [Cyclobacteriaceae bacterium]|jgi:hypothetical protein|nr:hypothetical protein [Cyclobacteriaceae bacterium]
MEKMEISELTLKLILLLIPGAISSMMFEKLTVHKKWTPFQFVTNSILLGGLSYLLAQLVFGVFKCSNDLANLWANLPTKDISYTVILKGTIAAPFIALGFTCIDYHKWVNKVGKAIGITNKYGDENLFTYFLNGKDVTEVYIRDIDANICYQGIVDSYSETDEIKEITLYDVKVYGYADGKLYYKVGNLYIAKPKDKLTIEVPRTGDNNDDNQTTPN